MPDPSDGTPTDAVGDGWSAVIDDMNTTASQYEQQGWTTLQLHPGDSVFIDSERRTGLDVILSGPEFEALERLVENSSFRDVEVFSAEGDGLVYLLAVETDPDTQTAVFVPAYYDPGAAGEAIDAVRDAETLRLFCRRLNDDTVEFLHEDPEPFLPDGTPG